MSDDSLCKINLKSGWKQKFFSSDILEKYQDIFRQCMILTFFRMDGKMELITCSTDGESEIFYLAFHCVSSYC